MARKKIKPRRITPLPEAIHGEPWRVLEGPPCVDPAGRLMFVPTGAGEFEESARAHEMVHVRITPNTPIMETAKSEGITVEAFNIVEDVRVHAFMEKRNIPRVVPPDLETKQLEFVMENAKNDRALAGMLVACAKTPALHTMENAVIDLVENGYELVTAARQIVTRFDRLASELSVKDKIKAIETVEGFSCLTAPIARLFDDLFPPPEKADTLGISPREYLDYKPRDYVPWGTLRPTRTARMTITRKPRGSSRVWSDEGVIPVAPYRLTVDSRVFARKRRLRGGTVLIDASGSMAFSPEDLAAVIDAAPGATVAAYAGRGKEGLLAIVAKDGRMATEGDINRALMLVDGGARLHGNIVDGPALQWLAKQPAPRIWISDGHVTGENDIMGLNLLVEANTIIANAGIERVQRWREVIEALS